jgi:hypothetical protein
MDETAPLKPKSAKSVEKAARKKQQLEDDVETARRWEEMTKGMLTPNT